MTVKQKFLKLINYKQQQETEGTYMSHLEPLELQQQSYTVSVNYTPNDVVALFGMNAIESSSDLCRRILAINNPAARGKIVFNCWRVLNE